MQRTDVKRQDLAKTLAARSSLSEGQAQDELDRVVHDIVTSLRQIRPAEMPGVGHMMAKPLLAKPLLAKPMTAKPSAKKPSSKTWLQKSAARKP